MASLDSFNCRREMTVAGQTYVYFDLKEAEANGLTGASKLPYTLKVCWKICCAMKTGAR
jgi:aconitate hydratase